MRVAVRFDTPPRGKGRVWFQAFTDPPWVNPRERDAVREAGFWFDGDQRDPRWPRNPGQPTKTWWTDNLDRAARLLQYAEPEAQAYITGELARRDEALAASRSQDADVELPVPEGKVLMPFQRAGVAYILRAFEDQEVCGVLNGDEPGLGKTVQALAVVNARPDLRRVLVVAPKVAVMVWQRHAEQWLTRPFRIVRVSAGDPWPSCPADECQLVIVNYDILGRYDVPPVDLLIVDEAHYVKNAKTARSKTVTRVAARRRLYLTGTPVCNRPAELWPLISTLDPATWEPKRGFFKFALRYCGAYQHRWGWDFSGASNLDELQEKLRSRIMVRRLKADVLTDLPAKVRQVIEFDLNGAARIVADQASAYARAEKCREQLEAAKVLLAEATQSDAKAMYAEQVRELSASFNVAFADMARTAHAVALAKVPQVIEHLQDLTEAVGKVVCFAWHRDVIGQIAAAFGSAAVAVTGDTKVEDREAAATAFQTDPAVKLFLGNIQAAGTAITLTAASHVVFAELDWVPGNLSQAEDRCHRIGQRNSVLVQHLVFSDSLDAKMAHTVIAKQATIDQTLDTGAPPPRPTPITIRPAPAAPSHPVLQLPMGDPGRRPLGREFLLAGRAVFTVSADDGSWRYTYQIRVPRSGLGSGDGPRYYLAVLRGPDNTHDYAYAGMLDPTDFSVRPTAKSKVAPEQPSMQVWRWFARHFTEGRALPPGYTARHAGLCGRCGRLLTTPESIDLGLGPYCARRSGWALDRA